jgi:hypothetical protein
MKMLACTLLLAAAAFAADANAPVSRKVLDNQLAMVEREMVPLAEAVPEAKYSFTPTDGVRTFGQQIAHSAAVIYACAAAVSGEKNPIDMGSNENGPSTLKSKAQIVAFLKDSIAYGRKALSGVTDTNAYEMVRSPFGQGQVARLYAANVLAWHSLDH